MGEAKSSYTLSTSDVELIIEGILMGAIEKTLPDAATCIKDIETTVNDVETAVADFKKETFNGVKAGIEMVGTVVKQLSTDLTDCKKITDDVSELEKMAKNFSSPWKFAYHVGKDLIVDGTQIFHEIDDAIKQYDAAEYYKFGEDVGTALSMVLVGDADHEGWQYDMSSQEVE